MVGRIYIFILAVLVAASGCSGNGTSTVAITPLQHAYGMPVQGTSSSGGLEVDYIAATAHGDCTKVHATTVSFHNDHSLRQELMIDVKGSITDLCITVPLEGAEFSFPEVAWPESISENYLKLAVLTDESLELTVSGIRKCPPSEIKACQNPSLLEALLHDRWSLSNHVHVCTVTWSDGVTKDSSSPSREYFDVRKRTSTPDEVEQVTDVSVRLIDGQYEVGWPLRLAADYNQDGEVGAMDLTPVGILYGLDSYGFGWLFETMERVDGDGNGQITSADITPLGYNYGNQLFDFRVEKSTGDETGPGETWESVGVFGRSTVTQCDNPVASTSSVPYQRILTETEPGWTYYRVVAIEGGGWEAEPSPPALAPDSTPPEWTADPELTFDESIPWEYYFTFNETAVDDRAVEYCMELAGGAGDPDEIPLMLAITNANSESPITSPYLLGRFNFPHMDPGEYSGISKKEGDIYHLRLKAINSSGAAIYSNWCTFAATYGENEYQWTVIADDWDVWVNREGTVRFTPPSVTVHGGLSPTDVSLYHRIDPVEDGGQYDDVEDYDPATRIEYSGGEITWERIIPRDHKLHILLAATDPDGKVRDRRFEVRYPAIWIKPFTHSDEIASFHAPSGRWQLQDGTMIYKKWQPEWDLDLLCTLEGGTVVTSSLEGVPSGALIYGYSEPRLNDVTGEIIFNDCWGHMGPGSVTWFDHPYGITGRADMPDGEFTIGFGDYNHIIIWEAESEDVLVGVRGKPVANLEDQFGIEVWEAHRNGPVSLRETVYPMELKSTDFTLILPVRDGQLGMVIHVDYGTNGFGSILYHDYYVFRDVNGEWLVIDGEGELDGFNPADWEKVNYQVYNASESTSFVNIHAISDVVLDPEEEKYLQYSAVYQGSLQDGLASFTKMYDYRNDEVFHPDVGKLRSASFRLIKPYDGHSTSSNDPPYVINPDGTITRTRYRYGGSNLDSVSYRWDNHDYVPTFVNAAISEDGQWISPGKEGVWGLGYWNDN